ncbi:hypothetical protein GF385_01015, partial [Candidatus Dependentiae bacterium]|nr:hypothetical protein [Candidatus Dependentiae bacterium]
MCKILKYVFTVIFFISQTNFVFSIKNEFICEDLFLKKDKKTKLKFVHINFNSPYSEKKDIFLIELENYHRLYSGFFIVSGEHLFNKFFIEDELKKDVYEEIKNSDYINLKNNEIKNKDHLELTNKLCTMLKNYKFVKAKDLVIGDFLEIAENNFRIKNIYNIDKTDCIINNFFTEDRHSFFYFDLSKNFHINNLFSSENLAMLTFGAIQGVFAG